MVVRARSQVLFSEVSPGLLQVDGALMEEVDGALPSGALVTLLLRLPVSAVVAAVVEAIVGRWADAIGIVDLELVSSGDGSRVVLTDGESTVRLEVEAAGSLAG